MGVVVSYPQRNYLITPKELYDDLLGTSTAPGRQPLSPRCRPTNTLSSPDAGSEFSSTAATAPMGTPANLLYGFHSSRAALSVFISTSNFRFL